MRRRRLGILLLAAGSWVGPSVAAQGRLQVAPLVRDTPPVPTSGTASLAGTVVAADTGRAVRRVRVTLSSVGALGVTLSATTADDDRFTFTDLPAGTFTLTATRPGFIDSTFGERQPGSGHPGTPVPLADGPKIENLSLAIARAGVITGTVLDDRGEPEFGAQVLALRWVMQTGERALAPAGVASTDCCRRRSP